MFSGCVSWFSEEAWIQEQGYVGSLNTEQHEKYSLDTGTRICRILKH